MEYVEVNEQSSVDEVEENRIFIHTLLESLDQGADDYGQQHSNLKSQLDYCDTLLSQKQNPAAAPSTPRSSRYLDPPSSASLPSRLRPAVPNWGRRDGPSAFADGLKVPEIDGYASESSTGHRKRHRADSSIPLSYGDHKAARMSHHSRPTTSSTSESADSLERLDFPQLDNRRYALYKRKAEEQEARWKQQRQDEALARQLSRELASSNNVPSASYHNQAYMRNDGTFARPQPSRPPQANPSMSTPSSYPPHVFVKPESDIYSYTPSPATNTTPYGSSIPGIDDSDDDVELITPQQFQSSSYSSRPIERPNRHQAYQEYQPATSAMPGAFPRDYGPGNDVNLGFNIPSNGQPSTTAYSSNPYGAYNSQNGQDISTMQRIREFAGGLPHSAFSERAFGIQSQQPQVRDSYHGQPGGPVFGYSDSPPPGIPGQSDFTSQQLQDLQARNLDYMLSDPSRTKDEIAQLLENIRPDEELPANLREGGPPELAVALMEHQKLGLSWLKTQEEGSHKGGILADDMGLGKTIQALALILARRSDNQAVKTTLIVAPVALLRQWEKEIQTKVRREHRLKVYVYHGTTKKPYHSLANYDVVLTTYGQIGSELKKLRTWEDERIANPNFKDPKPQPLNFLGDQCEWWRIILDEAQAIKGRTTQAAQAACRVQAEYRLVMTGTPMMNNINELYSLLKFLRIPPYNELTRFTRDFSALRKEATTQRAKDTAMRRLQAVLKATLLRRTKSSKIDGKPILNLKDRIVEEDNAEFDEDQQAFYNHIQEKSRLQFNKYLRAGTIGKNYSNILVMLLRLRQACDHPNLISDHGIPVEAQATEDEMVNYAEQLGEGAIQRIKEADGAFECPICYDASENPTIFFPCGHDVCSECFAQMMDPSLAVQRGDDAAKPRCPECREVVDPKKVLSYNLFEKVHLPEAYREKHGEEPLLAEASDDDSDSDSDSDDFDEDVNNYGDLDGFVVRDDEEVKYDSSTEDEGLEPWTKIESEEAKSEPKSEFKLEPKSEPTFDDDFAEDDFLSKPKEAQKMKRVSKARSKKKGKAKAKDVRRKKTLAELKKESTKSVAAKNKYLKRLRKNFVSSSKIDKTLEILHGIRDNDPTEKTIIFSQFTTFLDLLEVPIDDNKWRYTRYDGSMNAKARNEAVERFVDKPDVNIMLISLKAGNAGLNLNCASQVIILDPFWNPFIEEQAIDRAHRIGQVRNVQVHKVLIQNTVEDRIVALQEKKRDLINQALDEKAGQKLSRLGREELIFLFGSNEHGVDAAGADNHDEELRDLMRRPRDRRGGNSA